MGAQDYEQLWAGKLEAAAPQVPLRLREAVRGLAAGERVLDLGCGAAAGHELLRPLFREVHGTDVSERAVEAARARGTLARVANLDRDALPWPDDHFDAVLFLDVVEHLVDPAPLLGEVRRVLRPGGQLVLTTPNVRSLRQLWRIAVRGRGPRTSGDELGVDGGHLHYFTTADLDAMLAAAGLRVFERRGLVARLPSLTAVGALWPVRELLAAGLLVRARR